MRVGAGLPARRRGDQNAKVPALVDGPEDGDEDEDEDEDGEDGEIRGAGTSPLS
jgi:hypothetical protein